MIAARMANLHAGDNQYQQKEVTPKEVTSINQVASMLKVWRTSVERAKRVLRDGTAEQIAAIDRGAATVTGIDARLVGDKSVRLPVGTAVNIRGWRIPEKPLAECMNRGLETLDNTLDAIDELCARRSADYAGLEGWTARLEKTRTRLTRLIHLFRERVQHEHRSFPHCGCLRY